MTRRISFLLLAVAWLLTSCNQAPQGYDVPAQHYSRLLELKGTDDGHLYGGILFPSAYAQRSVRFQLGERRFVSEPDGRFRIEDIPVGEYPLRILVKSYEPIMGTVLVRAGEFTSAGVFKLRLARGKVVGRLVSETGRSAARVSLRLAPLDDLTQTDSDGIFQFIGVQSGGHSLLVTDSNYFTYDRKFSIISGEYRNLGNIKVFPRAGVAVPRTALLVEPKGFSPISRETTD
ncbi:MAG: hypothetical protein O7C61_05200 [SAR324 cluster bacterium]|nr:hypothetical protein [SAR324 cluster bacterium]